MKRVAWILILFLMVVSPSVTIGYEVPELNTPQKISNWLRKNIAFEGRRERYTVSEILQYRKGNCKEYSILAQFFLKRIGIESSLIVIEDLDSPKYRHMVCVYPKENPINYFDNYLIMEYPGSYIKLAEKYFKKWTNIEEWNIGSDNKVTINRLHIRQSLSSIALNKRLDKEMETYRKAWPLKHPEEWAMIQKFNQGDVADLPEDFKSKIPYAQAICPQCGVKLPGNAKFFGYMQKGTGCIKTPCEKCGYFPLPKGGALFRPKK